MEIPGHGRFAIYIHGGVHHGLWKLKGSERRLLGPLG
jgi:hypothetical protein